MSSIVIVYRPVVRFSRAEIMPPEWAVNALVNSEFSIVGEQSSAEKGYAVLPDSLVHGLRLACQEHAADWWKLYFLFRQLRKPIMIPGRVSQYLP